MTVGIKAFARLAGLAAAGLLAGGACGGRELSGSGGGGMINVGGRGGGLVLTGSAGSLTGAAGSGGSGGIGMECDSRPQPVQPLVPDILIVLDTSASMNDGFFDTCAGGCGASSKWAAVVAAIESVAESSTPIIANWGLQLMSTGPDVCHAGGVAVSVGPATGAAMRDALAMRSTPPGLASPGDTPARAAIDIATANRLAATDFNTQVIVLVTDGGPDCNPGEADPLASDAAGATRSIASATTEGISTCVIGLATAGGPADATLAQMAAAGLGSCPMSPPYVSINAGAGLVDTLNEIATRGSVCRYPVPPPPNSATNPDWLFVDIDGSEIPKDATNGWMYADASYAAFVLNGTACAASQGHAVSAAYHCLLQ